eukprot:scaffold127856_cov18-Tisochrysis_lutea.AAC.2
MLLGNTLEAQTTPILESRGQEAAATSLHKHKARPCLATTQHVFPHLGAGTQASLLGAQLGPAAAHLGTLPWEVGTQAPPGAAAPHPGSLRGWPQGTSVIAAPPAVSCSAPQQCCAEQPSSMDIAW